MIRVLSGNLFESKAQTLVNTVNCVGVMGKGVALGFKERFPEMFADYQRRCERGEVRLGRPYLFKHLVGPWIVNFPTKQHWRQVTNLQDIISGLEAGATLVINIPDGLQEGASVSVQPVQTNQPTNNQPQGQPPPQGQPQGGS